MWNGPYPDHERRKEQGRDDRPDKTQEDLAEHPQGDGNLREVVTDLRADDHRHQDPGG